MRILEIITLGEIGGAQTVLVDLVKGISKDPNVEIDVLVGEGDYLPRELSGLAGVNIIRTPYLTRSINPLKDIRALFQLLCLLKRKNYDLIHCHSSKASWLGRLAGRVCGTRVCVTVHGISFRPGIPKLARVIYRSIEKILIPLNCEYIFVSPEDLHEMKAIGLDEAKCRVIPNGRPEPPKSETSLRQVIKAGEDAPIVLMIGRLSEQKNPLSFIRVAQKTVEKYPAGAIIPRFILIGEGPYYESCLEAIDKAGLDGVVFLTGPVENAGKFFWEADVALLTSNYEACPLVAIEALAAGTPVVATDAGGTRHVITDGENGHLFQTNDEETAAGYIISLLTDRESWQQMCKNAAESYSNNFSVERMVYAYKEYMGLVRA